MCFIVVNKITYNFVYNMAYNALWIIKCTLKPNMEAIISIVEHENCE